jgi:hypothetical protein
VFQNAEELDTICKTIILPVGCVKSGFLLLQRKKEIAGT